MENKVKYNMLKHEKSLSNNAAFSKDAIRLKWEKSDIRTPYFRDSDRIIHSHAYTRYMGKTQVFSYESNDHITKRIIHVQLVNKIARTIGRALNLNEDLIEAMVLGHDLGHTPLGHVGESILNDISYEKTGKYFCHNLHSVRTLHYLEEKGKGLNLTIQTLDGIMCHNGQLALPEYFPRKKTKEEFLEEFTSAYYDKRVNQQMRPMTLEGCVVRISDIIGYLGRDMEDAVRLGVISKKDIPEEISNVLGTDNRTIVNTIVLDIIEQSLDKNYIKMSEKVFKALTSMKKFNYQYIYYRANTKEQIQIYTLMFRHLFDVYMKQIHQKNSVIYREFLQDRKKSYIEDTTDEEKVIDYIAGMTDNYFFKEYERLKNIIVE